MEILEELLLLGDLGIQYCIKSELAYSQLYEVGEELSTVELRLLMKNIIRGILQLEENERID